MPKGGIRGARDPFVTAIGERSTRSFLGCFNLSADCKRARDGNGDACPRRPPSRKASDQLLALFSPPTTTAPTTTTPCPSCRSSNWLYLLTYHQTLPTLVVHIYRQPAAVHSLQTAHHGLVTRTKSAGAPDLPAPPHRQMLRLQPARPAHRARRAQMRSAPTSSYPVQVAHRRVIPTPAAAEPRLDQSQAHVSSPAPAPAQSVATGHAKQPTAATTPRHALVRTTAPVVDLLHRVVCLFAANEVHSDPHASRQ